MNLFFKSKDGGPESNVTGYWLIEWKKLFSVAILRFDKGSREAFHNHAFTALSWVLKGSLMEERTRGTKNYLTASWVPILTRRSRLHKVHGLVDRTWVLTFRGPWHSCWVEYNKDTGKFTTLTNGRKILNENSNNRQSS